MRRWLVAAALAVAACDLTTYSRRTITINVVLEPVNNSGVSGYAQIVRRTNEPTTLTVNLQGLQPSTDYPGQAIRGSCAQPGEVREPLPTLRGDARGQAQAQTTAVPDSVLQQGFALRYLRAGTVVACGTIIEASFPRSDTIR